MEGLDQTSEVNVAIQRAVHGAVAAVAQYRRSDSALPPAAGMSHVKHLEALYAQALGGSLRSTGHGARLGLGACRPLGELSGQCIRPQSSRRRPGTSRCRSCTTTVQ